MRLHPRPCPTKVFFLFVLFWMMTAPVLANGTNQENIPASFSEGRRVDTSMVADLEWGGRDTLLVGIVFDVQDQWHTYWVNSGTTGMATTISLTLPDGWKQGRSWHPAPIRYEYEGLVDYIHEGRFVIVTEVIPDNADWADYLPSVTLIADVDWLECAHICVPGSSRLGLTLSGNTREKMPSMDPELISMMRQVVDAYQNPVSGAWWDQSGMLHYQISSGQNSRIPEDQELVYWFNESPVIDPIAPQSVIQSDENGIVISVRKDPATSMAPSKHEGFLLLRSRDGTETTLRAVFDPKGDSAGSETTVQDQTLTSFWKLLLLAFAGGLILNLMPCVFPVIGLKVMGFVEQAGQDRKKIISHGLSFTLGVLLSFWVLAAVLLILRSGGEQLGWGFQLQEPAFNYALVILLLSFGLSLSGVFEFGMSAVGVGHKLAAQSGKGGSFFSGVLATLVATPCSAPFLAPALGAALALPPAQAFILFNAIALGLSAPYLALSFSPGLISKMPRPGAWMESFKQFMAFLLYATVAYLLWALLGQVEEAGQFNLLMSLVLVGLAWWVWGRWGVPHRPTLVRRIALVLTLAGLATAIFLGYPRPEQKSFWEPWSVETLERHLSDGKTVYVDFTARWCATCQVNKRVVFSSNEVLEAFKSKQVVALQADWTNRDDQITRELERFGRAAVPFNLVYRNGNPTPVILPELLTPGMVLDAIKGD